MLKSKQDMEDQSHENVSYLIEELIVLRKEVPHEISDLYAWNNQEYLKFLKEVKITAQTVKRNYNVPDNPFEHIHQPDEKLSKKIYTQTQLLSILNKKKTCTVSKIIDEI